MNFKLYTFVVLTSASLVLSSCGASSSSNERVQNIARLCDIETTENEDGKPSIKIEPNNAITMASAAGNNYTIYSPEGELVSEGNLPANIHRCSKNYFSKDWVFRNMIDIKEKFSSEGEDKYGYPVFKLSSKESYLVVNNGELIAIHPGGLYVATSSNIFGVKLPWYSNPQNRAAK